MRKAIHIWPISTMGESNSIVKSVHFRFATITLNFMHNELSTIFGLQAADGHVI